MECMIENPIIEPKELPVSPMVEVETLLPMEVLHDTAVDDDDDCVICYQTLYRPAKTTCGHLACESCMLHWALMAMDISPGDPQPPNSSGNLAVDGIKFKCPTCRTYTEARFNAEQSEGLRIKHPEEYAMRAAEMDVTDAQPQDEHATQTMILMFGNSHRNVPPSISPYTGKTRTHEWTFFVQSSRQDLIEQVDVILHPTFRADRLVTLKKPPFSTTHLGWGYFTIFAGVQLREGWQWVDEERAVDSGKDRKCDRLPIDWLLDFRGNGSQRNRMVKFRKAAIETTKEVLEDNDDLGALAELMSEAEIKQYREVRRLRQGSRES